jgi:hypothetical protein
MGESSTNQPDTLPKYRYSGRKINESLGNVTVRGGKKMEIAGGGGSEMAGSLSEHV